MAFIRYFLKWCWGTWSFRTICNVQFKCSFSGRGLGGKGRQVWFASWTNKPRATPEQKKNPAWSLGNYFSCPDLNNWPCREQISLTEIFTMNKHQEKWQTKQINLSEDKCIWTSRKTASTVQRGTLVFPPLWRTYSRSCISGTTHFFPTNKCLCVLVGIRSFILPTFDMAFKSGGIMTPCNITAV